MRLMTRFTRLLLAIRIRLAEIDLAQTYGAGPLQGASPKTALERQRLHAARARLSSRLARLRGEYRARYLKPGDVPTYDNA